MIEARNLRKIYDTKAVVEGVSFQVPEGKTLVLLGTSGSGKTTTLKMLNRLIPLSGGEVFINNKDTSEMDPSVLRRNMGYVIQNIGLFPHLTLAENISIVPELLHWDPSKIKERIHFLFELLNLSDILPQSYPDELSGGQQQRIGIARALAADPEIILMDEPFGALDPITRGDIRDEFRKLEEIIHKTIVMVTHDILEAWELGDMICLMDQGKIVQAGTPYDLTWDPVSHFVSNFLEPYQRQLEMMTLPLNDLQPFLKKERPLPEGKSYKELVDSLEEEGNYDLLLDLQEAFFKFKKARQ